MNQGKYMQQSGHGDCISSLVVRSKMVFHTLILERPDGYQLQGTSFLARSKAELLRQLLMDQHGMAKAGIFVKLRL
eukprot:m.184412 g.184412  ORF g.184412 m.184412 type:complete len:76 (-) comp15558_c0_seq13:4583-4810(-)